MSTGIQRPRSPRRPGERRQGGPEKEEGRGEYWQLCMAYDREGTARGNPLLIPLSNLIWEDEREGEGDWRVHLPISVVWLTPNTIGGFGEGDSNQIQLWGIPETVNFQTLIFKIVSTPIHRAVPTLNWTHWMPAFWYLWPHLVAGRACDLPRRDLARARLVSILFIPCISSCSGRKKQQAGLGRASGLLKAIN